LLLAAIDPPVREIVPGAVVVKVPPPQVLELPPVTVSPAGNVSVTETPVRVVVVFGLVMVKVNTLVPFNGIVAASKLFDIEGGPITVNWAVLLVLPIPLSLELTAPVVLFQTPVLAPVTVTLIIQLLLAAIAPPVNVIVPGAVVVNVPPPQVVLVPFATVIPAGRVSVKLTPVKPCVVLGLVMVKVRLVVAPNKMLDDPKAFEIVGGVATPSVALAVLP